jgi:capsular polysaccharide biosynthesis protein
MELLQYWKVIQKSLWLVLLIVALGLSGTTAYTLAQPAQFESGTTLLLNPSVPSQLVPYVQTQVAANLADSYTQLMRTRSFADAVVKELSFPISAADVTRAITTRLRPNTLFYDVTVRASDPDKAQQLVKAVLKVFTSANADQQRQQAGSDSRAADSANQMRKRLEDKLKYLGDQITSYQAQLTTLESEAPSQERDVRLLQVRDHLVSLQQTETDTIVAISQLGSDLPPPNSFLVIDQPLPGRPVASKLPTNLALALAVSLLLGIGVAFLRDYLDYTIHSPEYLEEVLGLTPMAAIGIAGASDGRTYAYGKRRKQKAAQAEDSTPRTLVTLTDPKSPVSESFRVLRTNIQFSSVDKGINSLVVTSAAPGEGKKLYGI